MEHNGFYIDLPAFQKLRAEQVAADLNFIFCKVFFGADHSAEAFRDLVSRYSGCPVEWISVTIGNSGYDVTITYPESTEDLCMEVICEN